MNIITITGNLGRDPEVRHTQSQVPVCNFSVAQTESYKDKAGEMQKNTTWFKVLAWNKLAENCDKFLAKGSKVLVTGKMTMRPWEKDGVNMESWEIVANNVEFLSPPKEQKEEKSQPNADEIPW